MTDINLVLSGSGMLFPAHLGVHARLSLSDFNTVRVAGTSGGSIVAAGIALGKSREEMLSIASHALVGNILDVGLLGFMRRGWGLAAGAKMHSLLRDALPGRMGDTLMPLVIFVTDIEKRRPVAICSVKNPGILIADAVAASCSIPFIFRARSIPGMGGLYVDGGISVGFAMGAFDDDEEPTIGSRFCGIFKPGEIRNVADYGSAIVETLLDAANKTHVSTKRYQAVIDIASRHSGLDFTVSARDILDVYEEGWRAADAWLPVNYSERTK